MVGNEKIQGKMPFVAIATTRYEEDKSVLHNLLNCDNAQVHRGVILSVKACFAYIKTAEERNRLLEKCLQHVDNSYWLARVKSTKISPRLRELKHSGGIGGTGGERRD